MISPRSAPAATPGCPRPRAEPSRHRCRPPRSTLKTRYGNPTRPSSGGRRAARFGTATARRRSPGSACPDHVRRRGSHRPLAASDDLGDGPTGARGDPGPDHGWQTQPRVRGAGAHRGVLGIRAGSRKPGGRYGRRGSLAPRAPAAELSPVAPPPTGSADGRSLTTRAGRYAAAVVRKRSARLYLALSTEAGPARCR